MSRENDLLVLSVFSIASFDRFVWSMRTMEAAGSVRGLWWWWWRWKGRRRRIICDIVIDEMHPDCIFHGVRNGSRSKARETRACHDHVFPTKFLSSRVHALFLPPANFRVSRCFHVHRSWRLRAAKIRRRLFRWGVKFKGNELARNCLVQISFLESCCLVNEMLWLEVYTIAKLYTSNHSNVRGIFYKYYITCL